MNDELALALSAPFAVAVPRGPRLVRALLVGIATYVGAVAGYELIVEPSVVALWFPSGVVLAALLLTEPSEWSTLVLAAFAGNVAADLQHGAALALALGGSGANMLESVVGASLLRRFLGRPVDLRYLRDVVALTLGVGVVSIGVTALAGAVALNGLGTVPLGTAWLVWWIGDGLGILVVAPAILTVAQVLRERPRMSAARLVELAFVLAAIALIANASRIGRASAPGALAGYPYLAFPLLLWSALRLGPPGAALATLVLATVTVWNASRAESPFESASGSALNQVTELYLYLGLASLSSLIPASTLHERQAADARSRESEGRFQEMAEHINEAFFIIAAETREILYVSPTWAEIWGRPLHDGYDARVWFQAIHADDQALLAAAQAAVVAGHAETRTFRVRRPDGAVRWVRGRAFPVRDESGTIRRIVGVAEDVTALRETEDRYAQAQRLEAVGQLAGGVAHDFNNLLTVVMSHASLLASAMESADPRRGDVDAIAGAARSAAQLTRQLLLFGRQELLRPERLDLNPLILDTMKLLERVIGENIELVTGLDPGTGLIRADRGSLEQLIINLAVNARDAMPLGGRLSIETRNWDLAPGQAAREPCPPGRYVLLRVSDTGIGMDAATKTRAFEPFFTTKDRGKGTGLGLATVYGVVQQSGGYITIDSEPGTGASFTVYFPRIGDTAGDAHEAAGTPQLPRGTETILAVEDDPDVAPLVRRILSGLGYTVLMARNGQEALGLAATHAGAIDLLLTDVVMPGMSGREVADRFGGLRPGARILFMSGYPDDAMVRHGVTTSDLAYLQKPITPDALAQRVRIVLDGGTSRTR